MSNEVDAVTSRPSLCECSLLTSTLPEGVSQSRYDKLIQDGSCHCSGRLDTERLARLHNNRGQLHYRLVEFDEAVVEYTQAIALNGKLAVAFYNRGQIHYRLGRFHQAKDDFEKALELDANFWDAKCGLDSTNEEIQSRDKYSTERLEGSKQEATSN